MPHFVPVLGMGRGAPPLACDFCLHAANLYSMGTAGGRLDPSGIAFAPAMPVTCSLHASNLTVHSLLQPCSYIVHCLFGPDHFVGVSSPECKYVCLTGLCQSLFINILAQA